MFLSMQSLNGDSYQGAQVGANVQSQVGPPTRTVLITQCKELSVSCLCAGLSHPQSSLNHHEKLTQFDLQLDSLLWMEHFACQNTSHPIAFKQGYWLKFQTFQLTWMHLALTWTLGLVLGFWVRCSPLFPVFLYCCLILLLCVVVFHFICGITVVTQHTHLLCTKNIRNKRWCTTAIE